MRPLPSPFLVYNNKCITITQLLAINIHFVSISCNKHALHSILWSFMIRYPKIQTHSMHQHKFWNINKKNLHYNKFKLFHNSLINKFLESFLWKMMKNNKTFFGQISELNKEIKFCLLSCLLKHHIVLHTWNCSNLSSFPFLFHHKPCFLFHGELS